MKKVWILIMSFILFSDCYSQVSSVYNDDMDTEEYIIDDATGDTILVHNHYSYIDNTRYFDTFGYWFDWNFRPHRHYRHYYYGEPRYYYYQRPYWIHNHNRRANVYNESRRIQSYPNNRSHDNVIHSNPHNNNERYNSQARPNRPSNPPSSNWNKNRSGERNNNNNSSRGGERNNNSSRNKR